MSLVEIVFMATAVPLISCKSIVEQYYTVPNDTQTCANDLVSWCDGVKFPANGTGTISVVQVTMIDSSGFCQAICTADAEGTDCTKNGKPWLTCTKGNQLLYKGKPLSKDSLDNTDNSTCETADKAFNELFVQSLSSDSTTLSKELESGLEQLFRSIARMQERIAALQREFLGSWGTGGFPFFYGNPYPGSVFSNTDDTYPSTDENNRERE
ncbi:hypothetical protein JTE90_019269 [Oedothorax gibbosus]|uniref:Uncharacterized protein n=1 Tax=Oedothorax gibbosus TaxID=931172 RepID=A0AAV6UV70_9ARAC|nr:hypothetical protein JTE90_019269 [Oedothorax gibbosus]